MLKSELLEIIANGESSGVEFKRDDIRPEQLAKEVVAMANFRGGSVLLGVEDDGTITGIQRQNLEEWVMNVMQDKIHPMLLPFYEEVRIDDNSVIRAAINKRKVFPTDDSVRKVIYLAIKDASKKWSMPIQNWRLAMSRFFIEFGDRLSDHF